MATVFTLLATQVPVPIVPASLLSIAAAVPNTWSPVVANNSGSGSLTTPFNKNAARGDMTGRAGAGGYAIDWDSGPSSSTPGLQLTVSSGLTLAVGTGQAMIDGPVQVTTPLTALCTDNIARIHVWLSQAGAVVLVNNSLTPPAGAHAYLGSVVTSGGAITEINGSGVLYYYGAQLIRRTADTSAPGDTPPAGLSFFNRCASGAVYFWTGLEYVALSEPLPLFDTVIAAGVSVTIPAGKQAVVIELDVQGILTVNGLLKILGP